MNAMWIWLAQAAHGFCGTYVGPVGEALTNKSSLVVLTQNEDKTVLTMANDVSGDVASFGLLVPVPEGFQASSIAVIDDALLDALDTYTAPRVVSYTCDQIWGTEASISATQSGGCGSAPPSPSSGSAVRADGTLVEEGVNGVVIQSHASVGEYEIDVVSADGSSSLERWLDDRGFVTEGETSNVIGDYLAEGSWFLAARVDAARTDSWLSPLQLRFDGVVSSLPLRLGATSSGGVQDLVVYVIGDDSYGQAAISNYPEVTVEDECMIDPRKPDWYGDLVDAALEPQEGSGPARWTFEYGWASGSCDPCPGSGPLDPNVLTALGWSDNVYDTYVSRLRVRYSADQVDEDLHLYFTNKLETDQQRYIEYLTELEDLYPICASGFREDPGSCGAPPEPEVATYSAPEPKRGCLCATTPAGLGIWGFAVLIASARRARR